ncbi:MAG: hypothetical protein ACP5N9_02350 [Candidatus Bilamarchaeum sp.]
MLSVNSKILIIALLCGLVLFGCIGNSQPAQNTQVPNNAAPSSVPSTSNAPSGSTSPSPESTTTAPAAPEPVPTPSPAPSGQNLQGMAYAQLIGLGIPLECNIRTTYAGRTSTIHVYINGNHQIRSELGSMEGSRCSFVGVLKDNKMYLGCSSGSYIQNCDWLELDVDPSMTNTSSSTSSVNSMNYEGIPPADIQCNPWVLDTSKFATPGRVCSMNDAYGQGSAGYGNY